MDTHAVAAADLRAVSGIYRDIEECIRAPVRDRPPLTENASSRSSRKGFL